MSKEAKIIKDLKERNDRLNNQYMQEQARNYHLNYVIENDLEPTLKGREYEIITLKSDFEAQHELTKKYAEENQQLKEDYSKLLETSKAYKKLLKTTMQKEHNAIKVLDEIRDVLNNQMDYREFVDVVNAIEEILDKVKSDDR